MTINTKVAIWAISLKFAACSALLVASTVLNHAQLFWAVKKMSEAEFER